ncbi:OPA3-domain-containing protein [Wolfiporia cocos MD-104 SS10]|uniref:OPA3-domain-containing protein n=1 Tax=Wolfiporia cocos (strain MD-104) TaxID=742152 RepID=A0A2H3JLC8_WOLCO|nr:OPA3-domain-containing protein [Wolfiporia cocos MD-104 SS10]
MASAKIATLVIRTLAKPISNQIKTQVKQHETFRTFCVNLAQRMYRTEAKLRTNLLGEPAKHIRPLSETKAIENGANALAEGFLFGVAALLIIGETWRSSRSQSKRRDNVDDQLEDLHSKVQQLTERTTALQQVFDERWEEEKQRNDELTRILERVVEIGLRGGWAQFEDTPLALPRIQLAPSRASHQPSPYPSDGTPVSTPSSEKTPHPSSSSSSGTLGP